MNMNGIRTYRVYRELRVSAGMKHGEALKQILKERNELAQAPGSQAVHRERRERERAKSVE